MTSKAQLKWIGGLQFVARAGDAPAVIIDNPESKGGASPMQLVLIGVAGCTAIDVISIMQKKRAQIDAFQVNISAERAAEHPKRYTNIRIEYVLTGNNIKPAAVERAIQLSETKYCSATASLNASIESHYRIIDRS